MYKHETKETCTWFTRWGLRGFGSGIGHNGQWSDHKAVVQVGDRQDASDVELERCWG